MKTGVWLSLYPIGIKFPRINSDSGMNFLLVVFNTAFVNYISAMSADIFYDPLNILPNDFLTKQAQTPTGLKLNIPKNAGFKSKNIVDDQIINGFDGWPTSSFIILAGLSDIAVDYKYLEKTHPKDTEITFQKQQLSATLDDSNLINGFASHQTLFRSLESDSPSLLIDCETGDLLAHYIEVDHSKSGNIFFPPYPKDAKDVDSKSIDLVMTPEKRLKSNHRYIVVYRNLKDSNGRLIPSPYGFRVIRDNLPTKDAVLLSRKAHYQNRKIFDTILNTKIVLSTDEIFIAWDFTTSSLLSSTEHLRFMRDDAIQQISATGYRYTIRSTVDDYSHYIYRKVEGSFMVPLYIDSATPKIRNHLKRNLSDQIPFAESRRPSSNNEWAEFPFIAWIPRSLVDFDGRNYTGNQRGSLLQYGHGLFHAANETGWRFLHKQADEQKAVLFGTDWIGMARPDVINLINCVINDISQLSTIPERSSQGILNQLALMHIFRHSSIMEDPAVLSIGGKSVVEIEDGKVKFAAYFGISLGGIFGTVYSALSKEVYSSTIGVPGGPFSLLFQRNTSTFVLFAYIIRMFLSSSTDRLKLLFFIQNYFQICDPATYSEYLQKGMYAGENGTLMLLPKGPKRLLIQWSPTDGLVSSVGTLYLLRSLGAYSYRGDPYEVYYRDLDGYLTSSVHERHIKNGKDSKTRLNVLPQSSHEKVLHVASAFHFKGAYWASPFHNVPFSVSDLVNANTHDYCRLHFSAHAQMLQFMNESKEYEDTLRKKREVWVDEACRNGCWMLEIPNKGYWMTPEEPQKMTWTKFISSR